MCGFAGICHFDGQAASPEILRRMTDAVAHRGPDGEGHYVDGAVGLGHRRLAILDLSPAGQQPMASADGRYVIAYNGEVYNFRELRSELETRGRRFRSQTDTEVVLQAFVEWGERALDRFNGMFALAIWDREQRQLFLARDRYGIKPLYYTRQEQTLLFGSEVKALIAHPQYRVEIDTEALVEYFTFQNLFGDRTLYRDVKLLPAGCFLRVSADNGTIEQRCFWDFDFSDPEQPLCEEDYVDELERLFRQAVRRQLVSDVEVGSYLSGGMDSGSITAVAAAELPCMRTFTCGFDLRNASAAELGFDERGRAEQMSHLFGTEHYEMVLKAADMQRAVPRLTRHLEEPRVGQSYPNLYAAGLASRFVKVVLSGTGGDELFGGYPWRYYRAVVNDDFDDYLQKYHRYWQRLIPHEQLQQIFRPIWSDVRHVSTFDRFREVFPRDARLQTRPPDYVNHSLYFEAKTFLHGLLVVEDKLSMAHGLETRVPFLDNDLVDFAMQVPVELKLGRLADVVRLNEREPGPRTAGYFQKTRDGKLLLRKSMQRILPAEITAAEKQGFSAPDASWFREECAEYLRASIGNPASPIYDYLDRTAVGKLIDEHLSGTQNRRLLVWSLLNFDHWCHTFLNRDSSLSSTAA